MLNAHLLCLGASYPGVCRPWIVSLLLQTEPFCTVKNPQHPNCSQINGLASGWTLDPGRGGRYSKPLISEAPHSSLSLMWSTDCRSGPIIPAYKLYQWYDCHSLHWRAALFFVSYCPDKVDLKYLTLLDRITVGWIIDNTDCSYCEVCRPKHNIIWGSVGFLSI